MNPPPREGVVVHERMTNKSHAPSGFVKPLSDQIIIVRRATVFLNNNAMIHLPRARIQMNEERADCLLSWSLLAASKLVYIYIWRVVFLPHTLAPVGIETIQPHAVTQFFRVAKVS